MLACLAITLLFVLFGMFGCAAVGKTEITYPTPSGLVSIKTTKDEILKDFHLHSKRLADGSVDLSVDCGGVNADAAKVDAIQAAMNAQTQQLTRDLAIEALKRFAPVPVPIP